MDFDQLEITWTEPLEKLSEAVAQIERANERAPADYAVNELLKEQIRRLLRLPLRRLLARGKQRVN